MPETVESMTAVGTSNTTCIGTGGKLPQPNEAPVESDQVTEVSNPPHSSVETFELLFTHGDEAVLEEDGDVEVEDQDEDEEDDEGDVAVAAVNRPNHEHATTGVGGGHANGSTINDRRKKKRNRRRVRKRNTTSTTTAVNEVLHEGSHHVVISTNYVVEGVKPAITSSPTKVSTGTGTGNASSQQGLQAQANQRSKKPHDAPMTKSDLYYSVRCEMLPVEVEVRQSLPTVKSAPDSESSESVIVVVATIVRHVIGRVLLVNWDNVKVYDALVVPELSSTQLTLLQEEFKAYKSSKWATATLPYTFQVKRTMDDRSGPTGTASAAKVSPLSISELKPILKKMVKGKIVIGYNVQADLQLIDGMAHPKTDVRDLAQCNAYMSTIVTARPMSLHFSQDRQSIVHHEPKPLSLLIETFADSSNETSPKLLHQGLLFKEAVACLFLYKRVRSEWEDELSRSSRFRYKFPPMAAKSNVFSTPGKSSIKEMSLLPPPVSQQELWIPQPTPHHARSPITPQYGYDPSQPPSMMNILPGDRPNNRNNSLPMSSYHSSTTTSSYVRVDRDIRAAQYKDRRHHPNHPIYPEYERWNHDHASTGALPVDGPASLPSTPYHKPQLPVNSLAAVPPHARPYFGPNEYGTSPPTCWEMQRHVEANRQGTARLTTANEGMRWLNAQEDLPNFHKTATTSPEDPWRATSSLHLPDEASIIPSPIVSEQLPFPHIGPPNCLGSFDGVLHRNDRLPSTPAMNTWSPLATESFSLLSILNKSSVATASDSAGTQHMSPARAPTATTASVLAPNSNHRVFDDNEKNASLMFEWASLLASINDE